MLDRVLGNPLVGLSPWIAYSIVEGKGRLEVSAAVALGIAIATIASHAYRVARANPILALRYE